MSLKSSLHHLIDQIEDEQLLQRLYDILTNHDSTERVGVWQSLTEEQRREVLAAFDESNDDASLINIQQILRSGL